MAHVQFINGVDAGIKRAPTELSLLHALVAASTLRGTLEEERTSSLRLGEATAQLVFKCEPFIEDRELLIPLALVRQRLDIHIEETARQASEARHLADSPAASAHLRFARHALLRLTARLWMLLDAERGRAGSEPARAR